MRTIGFVFILAAVIIFSAGLLSSFHIAPAAAARTTITTIYRVGQWVGAAAQRPQ